MAIYRFQVVSVGMWRGKIKRWNTTFHTTDSGSDTFIYQRMQACGYKAPGDVLGACSGGTAQISVYNAAGGAPIRVIKYFDWQAPSTWVPYTGTVWSAVPEGTPIDAAGESAVVVIGHMAGLSATGKPVTTRKYLHAVPSRSAASYDDPDISAATATAIASQWAPNLLANPSGISPATITVPSYYLSHQRVRGRRRTVRQAAAQGFSNGVIVGGGAAAAQGAAPFQ